MLLTKTLMPAMTRTIQPGAQVPPALPTSTRLLLVKNEEEEEENNEEEGYNEEPEGWSSLPENVHFGLDCDGEAPADAAQRSVFANEWLLYDKLKIADLSCVLYGLDDIVEQRLIDKRYNSPKLDGHWRFKSPSRPVQAERAASIDPADGEYSEMLCVAVVKMWSRIRLMAISRRIMTWISPFRRNA